MTATAAQGNNDVMDMDSEELRAHRERFVAFAFATADILLELDEKGVVVFADGALKGILGRDKKDLIGNAFTQLIHQDDVEEFTSCMNGLQERHRMEEVEVKIKTVHGDNMPMLAAGFRLSNIRSHTHLSLRTIRGGVQASQLFNRDYDTGLLNTEGYVEAANEKIREARDNGEDVQVTLLDFPNLKDMLDDLDEEAAEQLLHEISDYLRDNSLDGDTAGMIKEGSYSFVHDGTKETAKVVDDIMNLTSKYAPEGKTLEVRSETVDGEVGELSAQDSANVLLYTLNDFAQNQGEEFCIESLKGSYEKMLDETVSKMTQFKQTVSNEEFNIAFQPIVDLKNGLIHHYEALVRMKEGSKFSNPFEFITFGEQAGIIGDFDLLLCQRVFDVLDRTSKNGNYPLVAVNLSGRSLESTLFKDALRDLIAKNKRRRKQMIFEVTESSKIHDLVAANEFLQEMREGGNLCCLDDFGAGESSFDYLRNLQVDFIKIDGSYVKESLKTQRGRHMLKAMSGLCRDLNVTTIGEMVEDEKAAKLLWEAGVKFGQGYLFGKPEMDEDAIVNCKKPTPFYGGMMRVRTFKKLDEITMDIEED
ncbi:MAG: EAL domain-containing protein [Rickettsiales bacterium]|nr:EAL domain-containing protein [Rickettsiales bacterium]